MAKKNNKKRKQHQVRIENINPSDFLLIKKTNKLLPKEINLIDKFNDFAKKNPKERLQLAKKEVKNIELTEWADMSIGKNCTETISQQAENIQQIADIENLFPKVAQIAEVHDLTRAILPDLNEFEDISSGMARDLRKAAAKVIFKGSPNQHALWHQYETGRGRDVNLLDDLKYIDLVNQATIVETVHPEFKKSLDKIWEKAARKIQTEKGLEFFEEALENRDSLISSNKVTSNVFAKVYLGK